MAGIELRELRRDAEYAACVDLQRETWGSDFRETVPKALLQVAQKVGGVTAGAFADDALIGFVFGITGIEQGQPVHWSDMLAVRASYRNQGIGERLKWYQRELLLARGVERMYWTFDPLDAKNAHLNFNRLGIIAREYVVDMYGETDSPLHVGGTDRLIAIWETRSARVQQKSAGRAVPTQPRDAQVEVPADIHALARSDPQRVLEWRMRTRAQFTEYLPGYVVTGFQRGSETGSYGLTSDSNFTA